MIDLAARRGCAQCGCPTAQSRERCAFCDAPLAAGETTLTLVRHGDGYRWVDGGDTVAHVTCITGLWDVADASGEVVTTLLPLGGHASQGASASVAMLAPDGALDGTIGGLVRDAGGTLATVRDASGEAALTARRGGPTGIHVVDRSGDIVALGSWDDLAGPYAGMEVLVTPKGLTHPPVHILALLLSVQLVAVDDLNRV